MKKCLSVLNLSMLLAYSILGNAGVQLFTIETAQAMAMPVCSSSISGGYSGFMGESFTFQVGINNSTGTQPGFAPITEVVFPSEVTFNSASFGGVSVLSSLTQTITDNDGGDASTGTVVSELDGSDILLPVGTTYVALKYPLGSHVPTQGEALLDITATLASGLTSGVVLTENISNRCGYELGSDALNNPMTDPPLVTAFIDSPVTPTVMVADKAMTTEYGTGDNRETTTGPNYPQVFTLSGDIATGATITGVNFTDVLDDALHLISVDSVADQGNGFTINFTPGDGSPVQTVNAVPFVPAGPVGAGGTLEVIINSALGAGTTSDVSVIYQTYVSDTDRLGDPVIGADAGGSNSLTNTLTTNGTYAGNPVPGGDSLTFLAKSLAIQKSSVVTNNIGPAAPSPGDRLTYTLNFQISDYFSYEDLVVEDLLSDGLTFVSGSTTLSIYENGGAVVAVPLVETVVVEASVIDGPGPYDFTACAGCDVAVTADITDDDDAVVRPADGETLLTFDIASAMDGVGGLSRELSGGPAGDTRGVITFQADVNESFIDGQNFDSSVDASDTISNNTLVSGLLSSGMVANIYNTDTSTETLTIPPPTFAKNLVAYTDSLGNFDAIPFASSPIKASPGSTVTYALMVDIPTGDLEDLVITDFLPIPFFDEAEITGFDAASVGAPLTPADGDATSAPAAGLVAWGSGTTGFPGGLPTPVITKTASENSFKIDFTDQTTFQEDPSNGITLELLFTVTASPEPMANGLKIVNQASFSADDSNNSNFINDFGVVDVLTATPSIELTKGVVATDNGSGIFAPATVGPVAFAAPGSSPSFTAPFSSAELGTDAIESNLSNVNAEDVVTYAIVVENAGDSAAYDIGITDSLPVGMSIPGGGLNLQVYDANGNDLAAQTTGGIFGTVVVGGTTDGAGDNKIVIDGPIDFVRADTDNGGPNEGENIVVITYDLVINVGLEASQVITNAAVLDQYAAVSGGTDHQAEDLTAAANVTMQAPGLVKSAAAAATGDFAHTVFPDLTLGEVVTYTLKVTFPEGTTTNASMIDNLPIGLGYHLDDGLTVDATASCDGTAFSGVPPAITVASPVGAGIAASGADLNFSFDASVIVPSDADDANNTFCISYNATVLDVGTNDGTPTGTTGLSNSARMTYGADNLQTVPSATSINVVEPNLRVTKTANVNSGDAGDTIRYTIGVDHDGGSSADAFDIVVTDIIPDDLTYVGNVQLVSGVLPIVNAGGDPTIIFSWSDLTLAQDEHEFTFDVTVNNSVGPDEVITNVAGLAYDNISGAGNANERGSSTNNDADFTINSLGLVKSVFSTSEAHTGIVRHTNTETDLALGESLVYRMILTVPEGTTSTGVLDDVLPGNMEITGAPTITPDANITFAPIAPIVMLSDTGGDDGFNDTLKIDFGTISNPADGDMMAETVQIDFPARLRPTGNDDGDDLRNTAVFGHATGDSVNASVDINVVEPDLNITKNVNDASPDAGDTITYTIRVDHIDASSNADAFDIVVSDTLPAGLIYAGNAAALTGPLPTVDATGDPTITFSYDGLTLTDDFYEFTFQATVAANVSPGQTIGNTAQLAYDSLPADNDPLEKNYTDSDLQNIVIEALVFDKTVLSPIVLGALNPANPDVNIGETVTYRLGLDVPESVLSNLVISDIMPDVFEVTGGSLISDDGIVHNFVAPALSDTQNGDGINDTVTFNFGNVSNPADADTERIIVEITAVVRNSNSAGTTFTNQATADYTENPGAALSDTVTVDVVEPSIAVAKSVNPMGGDAGETVTFAIALNNTGSGSGYDLSLTDTVPAQFLVDTNFDTDGLDNDGDGVVDEVNEAAGGFYNAGTRTFTWDQATTGNPLFGTLAASTGFSLQFAAVVQASAVIGSTINNEADLSYDSAAGAVAQQKTYTADDDADFAVSAGSIAKSLNTIQTNYLVGQFVPYRVTVTVPEGTTDPLIVTDIIPAGLAYVPGSLSITTSNDPQISVENTLAAPTTALPSSGTIAAGQAQTITFNLGEVINTNTDNGTTETIVIDYSLQVLNSSDNASGNGKVNSATVDFGGIASDGPVSAPNITVVEPQVSVEQTTDYTSGNTVTYTVEVENIAAQAEAVASDVVLTVTLPPGLTYNANEVYTNVPGVPTVNIVGQVITFTFATVNTTFDAANPLTFTYDATIPNTVAAGTNLDATVGMTYTSIAGVPGLAIAGNTLSSERTGVNTDDGGGENDYNDNDNTLIVVTRPDLSTSEKNYVDNNGGDIDINDVLTYTVTINNTGNLAATGIDLVDHVPANVDTFTILTAPATGVDNSQNAPAGNNTTGLLRFDDITLDAQGGANDSVTAVYTVVVNTALAPGTIIENNMTVSPANEGGPGGADQVTIAVTAPVISLDKTASASAVLSAQTVNYTINVSNTGDSEATNVVLEDLPPNNVNYTPGSFKLDGVSLTDTDLDADNFDYNLSKPGTLRLLIPNLAMGASVQLTYQVRSKTVSASQAGSNIVALSDDQGSNKTAMASVTVNPIPTGRLIHGGSSSGGGGGGGSSCVNCGNSRNVIAPPIESFKPSAPPVTIEPLKVEAPSEDPVTKIQLAREKDFLSVLSVIPKTGLNVSDRLSEAYGAGSVFVDVNRQYEYYESLFAMNGQGVMTGDSNGYMKPNANINRAELAKMMLVASEKILVTGSQISQSQFEDVERGAWYEPYVDTVLQLQLMKGYPERGKFDPSGMVTFGELTKLVVRAFGLGDISENTDGHWARNYRDALFVQGLLPAGLEKETNLNRVLTRGEIADVLYRTTTMVDNDADFYEPEVDISIPYFNISLPASRTILNHPSTWLEDLTATGSAFYDDPIRDRTILFAHSSIWDFDPTPYGPVFEPLVGGALPNGETFEINRGGKTEKYEVLSNILVDESETEYLADHSFIPNEADFIVFTCDKDISDRWIYYAKRIE